MQTEIRFHEGLKGSGVVVSVCYGNDRVIFDFGAPFRPDTNIYDGTVLHRIQGALKDAITLQETPAIDGIYPKQDLLMLDGSLFQGIEPFENSCYNSAILISHLHLDHMSNIRFLAPSIPVYMHKNAVKLHEALLDIDEGTEHPTIIPVEYQEEIHVGQICCIPYFSDHPCHGSAGYLIQTPDMTIYYTGDIRFHGLQKEKAFKEIEKLKDIHIDCLIADSTSYSPTEFIHDPDKIQELSLPSKEILEGMFLESSVYEDLYDKLSNSKGLGAFSIYHRDMQLIEALLDYTKKAHREIVFEPETAYVINQVLNREVLYYLPDLSIKSSILNQVTQRNKQVSIEEINQQKDHYLVQVSYKNILQLLDLNTKDGYYFHLFGDPFAERACANLEKILKQVNMNYVGYSNVYSFNHSFPNHLSYAIGIIDANVVVAVHSGKPEKLNPMNSIAVLPKQNVPYIYQNGTLIEK